jgi:hypothetical protein
LMEVLVTLKDLRQQVSKLAMSATAGRQQLASGRVGPVG